MAEDFTLPAFLQDCDVDTIHQRMMDMLPDDIDKTEAGFPWDFTRPTALIASELLEYYIPETLKLMFPQWSTGDFLDYLANMARLARKAPNFASVTIKITGEPGTVIATGTVFATPATEEVESVEFATEENCVLDENGDGTVIARAMIAGTGSNVNANTITMMSVPIEGIISITNPVKATGGTEEETDDALRERILEADISAQSYVGNNSDYKRWAEEVTGVGTAIVIPEWAGAGTVKIICTDSNGEAANQSVIDAVYNHIMSPQDPMQRLAPIGATLTVSAPEIIQVEYDFAILLKDNYEVEEIEKLFKVAISAEYKKAKEEGALKYSHVFSLITEMEGVYDLNDLTINGSQTNISLDKGQYLQTGGINIFIGNKIPTSEDTDAKGEIADEQ